MRGGEAIQIMAFSALQSPAHMIVTAAAKAYDPIAWNSRSPLLFPPSPELEAPPPGGLSLVRFDPVIVVRWSNSPAGLLREQTPSLMSSIHWTQSGPSFLTDGLWTWSGTSTSSQQEFVLLRLP